MQISISLILVILFKFLVEIAKLLLKYANAISVKLATPRDNRL